MTAMKEQNIIDTKQQTNNSPVFRKKRRHWHAHEKLKIIEQFDKGELYSAPGKPNCVIDPKSKEILSIFLIEGWKDAFRSLGLINKPKVQAENKVVTIASGTPSGGNDAIQTLLLNTLIENQKLKEQVESLRRQSGVIVRRSANSAEKQAKM